MQTTNVNQSQIDRIIFKIEEKGNKDGKVDFRTIGKMTEYNKAGGAERARALLHDMVSQRLLHTEQIKSGNGKPVDWYWLAEGVGGGNGNNTNHPPSPVKDNNIKISGSYTLDIEDGKKWGGELVQEFAKNLFALIDATKGNNDGNGGNIDGNIGRYHGGNRRHTSPGNATNETASSNSRYRTNPRNNVYSNAESDENRPFE